MWQSLWAARYKTWRLIKLTPKGVVFSLLFFSFLSLAVAALCKMFADCGADLTWSFVTG